MRRTHMSFERDIDSAERTLSPSDFGFHNALKRSDGRIVFLDFEYFGWDDPAKMTAEELARVLPVIRGLRERCDAPISIDTAKAAVAEAALEAGCDAIATFDEVLLDEASFVPV